MASHRPGDWLSEALCPQVDWVDFFPKKGASAKPAKRICGMCAVRNECAEYALTSPVFLLGVWGGLTENERKEFRRAEGIESIPEQVFTDYYHGTEAGYKRHQRAGEQPCGLCVQAETIARDMRKRRRNA